MANYRIDNIQGVLDITKSMADGNRLRVLMALRGGELCVCQVIALLGLAPSTVSKHMSILRQSGLVESRKDGRWVYYRLGKGAAARGVIRWLGRHLGEDTGIVEDSKRLRRIMETDPEVLCSRQGRR